MQEDITGKIQLRINALSGSLCSVDAQHTWAIHEVKAAIESATQVPQSEQRLLYRFQILHDYATLSSVLPGSCIADLTLVRRFPQQAKWLQIAKTDWSMLLGEPADAWADKEVVMDVVMQCGWALKYAAPELQADRQIVSKAVCQSGLALQHAAAELKVDWEVALAAVEQCGRALEFASDELRSNPDFMLAAMHRNGHALKYVGPAFGKDHEINLAAVRQCGRALAVALPQLQRDHDIVEAAVMQDPSALAFAAGILRSDPELKALATAQIDAQESSLTLCARGRKVIHGGDTAKLDLLHSDSESMLSLAPLMSRPPDYSIDTASSSSTPVRDQAGSCKQFTKDITMTTRGTFFFGSGRSDACGGMKRLLGAQGAQLCEMANLGLPVPPGFCLISPTEAEAQSAMKEALVDLEQAVGRCYGDPGEPLLLTVRSGCGDIVTEFEEVPVVKSRNMVSNLGLNDVITEAWAARKDPQFVWDCYRRLISSYAQVVKGLDMEPFKRELEDIKQRLNAKDQLGGIHEDCHIPTQDLRNLVQNYKFLYERLAGEPFPQCPQVQLQNAIDAVCSISQDCMGANYRQGLPGPVAIIQTMVFGIVGKASFDNLESSEWLENAQSEDFAAGIRTKQKLMTEASQEWATIHNIPESQRAIQFPSLQEAMPSAYKDIAHCMDVLKSHFQHGQSVEFVVQHGKLWLVQILEGSPVGSPTLVTATNPMMWDCSPCILEPVVADEVSLPMEPVCADLTGNVAPCQTLEPVVANEASLQMELGYADSIGNLTAIGSHAKAHSRAACDCRVAAAVVGAPGVFTRRLSAIRCRHSPSTRSRPANQESIVGLPVWQTMVAGGMGGAISRTVAASFEHLARGGLSSAHFIANARAFHTGAICCTCYVNLLQHASADGNPDHVTPLPRLACAAIAMTAGRTATHMLAEAAMSFHDVGSSMASGKPVVAIARTAAQRACLMPAPAPAAAFELCAIDLVKNVGAGAGYEAGPGLLVCSGGIAGAITQAMAHPIDSVRRLGLDAAFSSKQELFRSFSTSCLRAAPVAGVNSLVRIGLVSYFTRLANQQV